MGFETQRDPTGSKRLRLEFERLTSGREAEWDQFADMCQGGSLFHKWSWMKPLDPEIHVVRDSTGICAGLLSCPRRRFGVHGRHLPPYTPLQGPLVRTSQKKQYSSARAERRKWLDMLLDGLKSSGHEDYMILTEHTDYAAYHQKGYYSSIWMSHEITVPVEDWQNNLPSNMRSKYNKLMQMVGSGELQVQLTGCGSDILDLAESTSKSKNYDMRRNTLETLMRPELENHCWTGVAITRNGETLGGSILFHDTKHSWNMVNGVRRDLADLFRWTNVLVIGQCIAFSQETGRTFDFEGSLLPGVEDFYRMMGGEPKLIVRLQRSHNPFFRLLRAGQLLRG